MRFNSIALHGGRHKDSTKSCVLPIYQTAAYDFDSTEYAANLFELKEEGNIYTRLGNPTTEVLEKRMAMLEGGIGALATASGASAIMYAILNIVQNGDEIISTSALYGGTHNFFANILPRFGIKTIFVESNNTDRIKNLINDKTKLIFTESMGNPTLEIADIEKLANIAHNNKIPLIIDNTIPTPYLLRPIEFGADIVIYSATKFLGGHGNSLGGIIVDSGNFDWENSGKFPELTTPDKTYHDIIFTKKFGKSAYIAHARTKIMRDTGACISPFNSFLILQGIETLFLRMKEHCKNAIEIANFLDSHPFVKSVNYPALPNNENYALVKKYLPKGASSIIGFNIKGGKEAGAKFINNVQLISHLANIGDAKSLVTHPATTTHSQMSPEELLQNKIGDDFIRLSVGLEDIEDIKEDLDRALNLSQH